MLADQWVQGGLFDYWDKSLVASVQIPEVDPLQWLEFATIELTADCLVLAGPAFTGTYNGVAYSPGQTIWNTATDGAFEGMTCDANSRWKNSGTPTGYEAFYFIWGNVEFNAMPYSWIASFVALGSFKITAKNEYLTPYYGEANYGPKIDRTGMEIGGGASFGRQADRFSGDESADHIFLLAGNDIVITSEGYIDNGLLAAGGEFKISNQGTWIGGIIAKNYASQQYTNQVTVDGRTMSVMAVKNLQNRNELTNQGMFASSGIGLGSGTAMKLTAVGWRELVH
jgi:hypothetical protein